MKHFLFLIFLLTKALTVVIAGHRIEQKEPLQARTERWMTNQKQSGFQQNKGQVADMEGKATPHVLFRTQSKGMNIYVTERGLTYCFTKVEEQKGKQDTFSFLEREKKHPGLMHSEENHDIEWRRVDMYLQGGSILKENIAFEEDITQGKVDYYLGHCPEGAIDVRTYSKVIIRQVYPGIDWMLYTEEEGRLKQDFVVHPGASPMQIKLIYEGIGKIDIQDSRIEIITDIGELKEGELICYQQEQKINARYAAKETGKNIEGGFSCEVSIEMDNYDTAQPLVIDPILSWATYYGGNGDDYDYGSATVTDKWGNVFVTGYTNSADFPLLNAGGGSYYQGIQPGSLDIFILKFNNAGVRQWATYYGGNSWDLSYSVEADKYGSVFITGDTRSGNFPLFNPGGGAYFQGSYGGGGDDAFILKFTNTGVRQWATYYGGTGYDRGFSIKTDNTGNVYVGGHTSSTDFPLMNPGGSAYFQGNYAGNWDGILLKFNNNGVRAWATYFGGSENELGRSFFLDTDCSGNLFVTGTTSSLDFPLLDLGGGAYFQGIYGGGTYDAFILKFTNNGALLWSTYYGGNPTTTALSYESGYSITVDVFGDILIAGQTSSLDFPVFDPGGGAYFQGTFPAAYPSQSWSAFILKFTNSGVRQWATYYGGKGDSQECDVAESVTTDGSGNIYVTGSTNCRDFPVMNPGNGSYFQGSLSAPPNFSGLNDIFILKFDNYGIRKWATYYGGIGGAKGTMEEAMSISCTGSGDIFLTGQIISFTNDFPVLNPGSGAYFQGTWGGGERDAYVLKFKNIVSQCLPFSVSTANSMVTCYGANDGSATVVVNGSVDCYNYLWTPSGNTTSSVTGLSAGNYSVTITSFGGCDTVIGITITEPPAIVSVTSEVTMVSCNAGSDGKVSVNVSGGVLPYSYIWSPYGGNAPSASGLSPGIYTVTVTDANQCSTKLSVPIDYNLPNALFIPNAFSPNNDDENDFFRVYYNNMICLKTLRIIIYNRWGEKVFSSQDPNFQWDGTDHSGIFKGTLGTAVFVYYLQATLIDGTEIIRKENVSLVR